MALQNLRSNTAHKRPTPASMSDGQIALNTNATDTGLFFKDASGNLVKAGPVSVGTSAPNSSAAGSSGNSVGEIWLDTTSSNYIVKVWDGTAWRFDAGLAYLAGLSFTNESTFKQSVNLEIGVDVQAYDADTTKNDVANTFVLAQTFTAQSVHNGGVDVTGDVTISDKIVHSGDTNTAIRFPAADTFAVETGGSERIRVTSTGALAIEGASNYGSSGQVLTSNGNDAPTWQDAAGGGVWNLLSTTNASNATTVDITSNIDNTYDHYVLQLEDISFASYGSGNLSVQAYNNSTLNTSNNYTYGINYVYYYELYGSAGASGPARAANREQSNIRILEDPKNNVYAEIHFFKPSQASSYYVFMWNASYTDEGDTNSKIYSFTANGSGAMYGSSFTNINGIRLFHTGGSSFGITGKIKLYGIS